MIEIYQGEYMMIELSDDGEKSSKEGKDEMVVVAQQPHRYLWSSYAIISVGVESHLEFESFEI